MEIVFSPHLEDDFAEIRLKIELDYQSLVLFPFLRWNAGGPARGRGVDEPKVAARRGHRHRKSDNQAVFDEGTWTGN